jgi:histone acetyltransferase (RNA polymerase elongator complex component)
MNYFFIYIYIYIKKTFLWIFLGSSYEKDIEMFEKVFSGTEFQLDYCKIYPCLDLPYTVVSLFYNKFL